MGLHSSLPDCDLVPFLKEGDEAAFALLYDRYKYKIAGHLLKLLKSPELTEEVLQDLFMKIWINRDKIDVEKSFKAYLFRIAENLVFDVFRQAERDKRVKMQLMTGQSESYLHIEEKLLDNESRQLLANAIAKLPPQRKMVFTLCKIDGKSYKEVSEIMGISSSTINDHLLKANQFLRKQLQSGDAVTAALLIIGYFLI